MQAGWRVGRSRSSGVWQVGLGLALVYSTDHHGPTVVQQARQAQQALVECLLVSRLFEELRSLAACTGRLQSVSVPYRVREKSELS